VYRGGVPETDDKAGDHAARPPSDHAARPPALATRPMRREPGELERFGRCFAGNGSPKRPELLAWQYLDNPTGELFVDFALAPAAPGAQGAQGAGDELAAIYATLPVRFRIAGQVALATQSVDTITDAGFRGRGLFVQLAKATYARAAAAGAKLVYGFPNGQSAHGFFERLGWTSLDPVPFLIRPLRTRYLVERLKLGAYARLVPDLPLFVGVDRVVEALVGALPGVESVVGALPLLGPLIQRIAGPGRRNTIEQITRFDERATALWHTVAGESLIGVERDARYLNWRLIDKPFEHYDNVAAMDGDRMTALVSHCVKDKHGGRIGYLMEALARPGAGGTLRSLVSRALGDMTRRGADVALAWCLPHAPAYRTLLASGFVPFPERYRPIELHAGVRAFDAGLAGPIADRRRWYLSYLDSDTV
jgi:GNAT superfamily N-acetyltransferase